MISAVVECTDAHRWTTLNGLPMFVEFRGNNKHNLVISQAVMAIKVQHLKMMLAREPFY